MGDLETNLDQYNQTSRLGKQESQPTSFAPPSLSHYWFAFLLTGAGLALLAWAGWIAVTGESQDLDTAFLLGPIGLGLLSWGAVLFLRRRARFFTLTLFERGLAFERSGKRQLMLYQDLDSFSLRSREELHNGLRVGLSRRVVLGSPQGKISFDQLALDNHPDTLSPLLDAVVARLAEAAEGRARSGDALRGQGWTLQNQGVSLASRPDLPPVPLSQITETALFEGNISLWQGEDSLPFFSASLDSPNVYVLQRMVTQRLQDRPEKKARATGSLGRLLFKKKSSGKRMIVLAMVVGALICVASVGLILIDPFGLIFPFPLGLLFIGWAVYASKSAFECYEKGLVKKSPFGQTTLLYSAMDRMHYAATRQYVNGGYQGTSIQIRFFPEGGGKSIGLSVNVNGSEEDLEFLRDQVSQIIAGRLYERLSREAEVHWTPSVRLSKDGVHFFRAKLLGQGPPAFADFSQNLSYSFNEGYFHLFTPGDEKSVLSIACSEVNFFPGFVLFRWLATEKVQGQGGKKEG